MQTSANKVAIHQVPGKDAVRGCGLISDKWSTNTSHSRLPYQGPEPFLRLIHADGRVPLCSHRRRLALFGRRFAARRFYCELFTGLKPGSEQFLSCLMRQDPIWQKNFTESRKQSYRQRERECARVCVCVSACVCVGGGGAQKEEALRLKSITTSQR